MRVEMEGSGVRRRQYDPANEGCEGRVVGRQDVSMAWARYVGPRDLDEDEEIKILNNLRQGDGKKIIWTLHMLYLTTKYWRRVRKVVLERDNYACVKCYSIYCLSVDHKRYPKEFGGELMENLQTLCSHCHANKTKKFDFNAWSSKAVLVDFNGDAQLFAALRLDRSRNRGVLVERQLAGIKLLSLGERSKARLELIAEIENGTG